MAEAKAADKAAEKQTGKSVLFILEDRTMTLKDLQAKATPLAIGTAWSAGLIQFGRRSHVVTGPAGKTGSRLVIEPGVEWTGPKTSLHKTYQEMLERPEAVPDCPVCCRPDIPRVKVVDQASGAEYTEMGEIKREEAHAMLAVHVKLTDKGMRKLHKALEATGAA